MKWIKEMDSYNFLTIYDVMLSIKEEMNISPDEIVVPQLPRALKFPQLLPIDSVRTRGEYCLARLKATKFLKKNGIITDFKFIKRFESWTNEFRVCLEKETFEYALDKMKIEYRNRWKKRDENTMRVPKGLWELLHPKIVEVAKSRFQANQLADSVGAALKEVNKVVKDIVKQKINEEYDGARLMNKAFTPNNPIVVLGDLSTQTGKDLQIGYMQIFSGVMTGVRNPKAHDNIVIDKNRAIHFLFLASLLMSKIDESK